MAHILVIDDDEDILRLLEFALAREGYEVTTATDGIEGLAAVERATPDLIVADVMMPKLNGYEFCRRVRAKPETAQIPIIIFSARFQPIDKQTALEAGATDYLPKSTSPDVLVKRIKELLPPREGASAIRNRSIGFFSLRGGTGVTSLAVNSAITLALAKKTEVALVDLSPLGGHTALTMGLRPTRNLADALTETRYLNIDSLKSYLLPHRTGVQLLASPPSFEMQFSPNSKYLSRLAELLKSAYSFTIFDMSHQVFSEQISPIWKQLDTVVLVLSADMPSIQSAAMALQGLAWVGVSSKKIALIVNQVTPQYQLPIDIIQKSVKRSIIGAIPFEPKMVKAVNSGQPLMLDSPKSQGALAIARLTTSLAR